LSPAAVSSANRDPFAIAGALQSEAIPSQVPGPVDAAKMVLPPLKAAGGNKGDEQAIDVPAPPKECAKYVANGGNPKATCGTRETALVLLDEALGETEALRRDGKLAPLEGCAGLPGGLVRALRADLGPAECGDALVAPVLRAKSPSAPEITPVLLALGLGARLRRTAVGEPKLAPPFSKQRVTDFIKGPMTSWVSTQAAVVEQISRTGVGLSFYARGIVAVEAGMADMRIVEVVRAAPLPDEFSKDSELKDAFFSNLEQSLDPRKVRGRDAALVGMRDLASVGVITDPRVDRARALLSKMFGGRRIDALDALVLPALAPATASTLEQRLASRLPTFYSGLLLPAETAREPGVMRQFAQRGIPVPQRRLLQQSTDLPREIESLAYRARIAMGQKYWRGVDFDEATALAVKLRASAGLAEESTMMLALSLALRGGPRDAAEMMFVAPALSLGLGNIGALDAVAKANPAGPYAGIAGFDAAMILQVSPADKPDAAFWLQLAGRYRAAGAQLQDPELKKLAEQRARSADEIARAAPATH
jgi:hypothetical protein